MSGLSEGFRQMIIMFDISQLSLRKLACIHVLISVKQLVRGE